MNAWKKIFTLSLVAFQMSTFAFTDTAHAADGIVTLADLHNSKYNLNSNTKISFGKLYSPSSETSAKKYSLMSEDDGGSWNDMADGHQREKVLPTSINDGMEFNSETSPWQNEAVYVDFSITGDDTAIIEKSAHRCYDCKVVGGNSSIEYTDQVPDGDYVDHVMQGEDFVVSSSLRNSWDYYQHGDGWGYGQYREDNGIEDGKWGTELGISSELEDYYEDEVHGDDDPEDYDAIDDLDDGDIKGLYEDYINWMEDENPDDVPHLYILCRSSGTKWTRIRQKYAVSKIEFTVVHAEDVNGNDVKSKVEVNSSGITYDTTPISPQDYLENYSNQDVSTYSENRVHGTLKIDGKNGYKNVAANIVVNAKVVEWKMVGWGYIESEEAGPTDDDSYWPQFGRTYGGQYDVESGSWWNNTGSNWPATWHEGWWNDRRSYQLSESDHAPETINLTYNQNSYDGSDDGYNIDETDPADLTSKSWYDYNTSKTYTRGAFGVIGNWVNKDITTQIYSRDNLSGIDTDRSYIYIDDKSWYGRDDSTRHYFDAGSERIIPKYKMYDNEDEITFSEDGIYYVEGKLWDIADNYHSYSHGAYKLDKTKPDIPLYSDDTRAYIDDLLTVTVTLRDNLSGVDHVDWAISRNSATYNGESKNTVNITTPENSPNAATSFNVPINSNGTWYIHTWVTDRAGNVTYKMSNGYKFFKITPGDVTVNPTANGSNILRGTRFDVVTTIPYFTQEDGYNSTLHYIMPNWVNDDVDKKVNGQYAITPGTGTDTHCSQYGPSDQAILWKAYAVPYGTPLTKNRNGDVIGSYQTVVIRLQYTNYIYGEKITHDLPINYSVIPEVIVKTEIINNPL